MAVRVTKPRVIDADRDGEEQGDVGEAFVHWSMMRSIKNREV